MYTRKLLLACLAILISISAIAHFAQAAGTGGCGLAIAPIAAQISVNEPWYCPINQQIYGEWVGYLPAAIVVIFLSFAIAAVIFMVGTALGNDRIRNFGISEFYEAIATAIIVMAFLYICAVVFGLLPAAYVGNINPYATSFNLITKTISTAQTMYAAIFNSYFALSASTTPTISLELGGVIGTVLGSFLTNLATSLPQVIINAYSIPVTIFFLDPALAITRLLTDGILGLYAEYYLLVFFSVAAIPAFLVPGVFFRAIFPTRAIGGILIAMAFGFYLIMPTLFSVTYYFTAPTLQRDMGLATLQMQRLNYVSQNAVSAQSPLVVQLHNVQSSLNGFWLLIFFYPGLIATITYVCIQEISRFIGRAVHSMGRMRAFI